MLVSHAVRGMFISPLGNVHARAGDPFSGATCSERLPDEQTKLSDAEGAKASATGTCTGSWRALPAKADSGKAAMH